MQSLTYVKSIRGKDKLVNENFIYVKDKCSDKKTIWKCEYFYVKQCKARVHTANDAVVCTINEHNHQPELAKVLADTTVNTLKRRAADTKNSPVEIIAEISKDIHISVAAKLPSINQLKKTINRVRRHGSEHPPNPDRIDKFSIPELYKITNDNEKFLIYDSGKFCLHTCGFNLINFFVFLYL